MGKRHTSWHRRARLFIMAIFLIIYTGAVSANERLSVVGKIANIRYGPGTKYDILFQAERYYPINIIKKSGNWYEVEDFEGDVGWIHKSMVSKVPSVITIKLKCNIRSGPGLKYEVVFVAEKGVPFKSIKRKGNWIHVKHSDGYEGWIHKSLVW